MSEPYNVHRGGHLTRCGAYGGDNYSKVLNQLCKKRSLRPLFSSRFLKYKLLSTAVDQRHTSEPLRKKWHPTKEVENQPSIPGSPALLRSITISKEIWKEPLSIIESKRQTNRCLRRDGNQVSSGGQFAQHVANRPLGNLKLNLRFNAFQCTMSKNCRD